jgi:hypothetical protein
MLKSTIAWVLFWVGIVLSAHYTVYPPSLLLLWAGILLAVYIVATYVVAKIRTRGKNMEIRFESGILPLLPALFAGAVVARCAGL